MPGGNPEERVVIIAPVGQDAIAMARLFKDHGLEVLACNSIGEVCRALVQAAGVLVLTEEVFELAGIGDLLETLRGQPSWSELPLTILTQGGEPRFGRLLDMAASAAGSVTLLERPLGSATLLRSVEVALRSRRRQYQVRDLLEESRRRARELESSNAEAEREIAERKRAEQLLARRAREQAALYQFTNALQRARALKDVYEAALDAIFSALGCQRASILLFDDQGIMRFVAWRGLSDAYRKAVEGHSPWKRGERDPNPIPVPDVEKGDYSQTLKEQILREDIGALAFVPLVAGGNLIGKFMTYYDAPHSFAPEELELALTLARQMGLGVERKRAEDAKGRLAAIVECSEDAIVSKDLNGVIISWNRGAERLFGWPAQDAIGRPITLIIPEDRLEEEPRILAKIRAGEAMEHYETVRRCKDGRLVHISLTVSPILDAHGKVVGASKIARDITDRKRAEQELRQSEERYRTLVEQVKDYAIFRMDNEGRATSWNEGVRRVLGYEEGEFIGQEVARIFTPEDVQAGVPWRELREAAEKGTAGNDRWLMRADQKRFYATGVTTALRDESGRHIGFTKVLRDMTALAEAQAALRAHTVNLEHTVAARTKDLQASNEQLEAFVYSIAHDLRTPLCAITGYAQLLQDDYAGKLEETGKSLLRRIHSSSEFMDKLLLDLLAFGRTAKAEIELSEVDVQKAWNAAVFQCASQIEQTNADVQAQRLLPKIIGHEPTLGQSLANLLSNALKFVAPGTQPIVRLRPEQRADWVRLWVEDNGMGIPPDQRERIFRVFERLHGARFPGTGIGLSIVRKGVERMGGSVGVESEPGRGSRFWIELPTANGTG